MQQAATEYRETQLSFLTTVFTSQVTVVFYFNSLDLNYIILTF